VGTPHTMMMAHHQDVDAAAPYDYAMYGNMEEFDHSYFDYDTMGSDWPQSTSWLMDEDDDGTTGCGGSDVPLWNY
jgi:hypothetical protein